MDAAIVAIIGWLAQIMSTLIITIATGRINSHIKRGEMVANERHAETEAKRKAEAEWRGSVDRALSEQGEALRSVARDRSEWYAWRDEIVKLMDKQDERIESLLKGQCTQMRSDILHRAHRYLDDLGMASTDEKKAFWAEYEEYCGLCEKYGIKNNFVDGMANRVMALPEREIWQTQPQGGSS